MFVPESSALLLSALPSAFGVSVPVPRSSALLLFALLSVSGAFVLVSRLSAPPFVSSMSGMFVSVPGSLASPSVSSVHVPVPELSPLLFPIWSNPQILMPVPGRQRLGQWSGILKKASSKETSTTFAPLFLPSEYPSPLFFPFSGIGKKWLFDKAFNINCQPLADDHTGKDVGKKKFDNTFINTRLLAYNHAEEEMNLSFAGCGCSLRVKLNMSWQIEFLKRRPTCIVEIISLSATIS